MSVQAASASDNASRLVSELFARGDANKDGQINGTEFQSFLEGLVRGMANPQAPGLAIGATAAAAHRYQPMAGFDSAKLNDPRHATPKYVLARATQDVALGNDRASRSAGLAQIAENVRQHGYPNAKVTGDDTIDFADGFGAVDVLTGGGDWWWGTKA